MVPIWLFRVKNYAKNIETFIIFVVNFIKFIKQANIQYYEVNESVWQGLPSLISKVSF